MNLGCAGYVSLVLPRPWILNGGWSLKMFKVPEKCRVTAGRLGSDSGYGNNGYFLIKSVRFKRMFNCIVSDELGWEHVSVSLPNRCLTWEEMCFIKDKFWDEQDCVVQYHPPKSEHINNHPYCLHLWRPTVQDMPMPPSIMVDYPELNNV